MKDVLTYAAVIVPVLIAGFFGLRKSSSDDRLVSANEVEKLGERLDKQAERIDALTQRADHADNLLRQWREFGYRLIRILEDNDIESPEPPADV